MKKKSNMTCFFDLKGTVLDIDKNLSELLGYTTKEIIGNHINTFILESKEYTHQDSFYGLTLENDYLLIPLKSKNNQTLYMYIRIRHDLYNGVEAIKAHLHYIENLEESIQIANKILDYEKLIRSITNIATKATSKDTFIDDVLAKLGETFKVDHTFLYKYVAEMKQFQLTHAWFDSNSKLIDQDRSFTFEDNVEFRSKLEAGITHFCSDTSELENIYAREVFKQIGVKAYINEPVFINNKFYGFIGYNMITTNRDNVIDDISILNSVGRILTQTLERIEIIELLRQREFFSRIQIKDSTIGMAVFDYKTKKVVEANKAFNEIIGYTNEEFVQINWEEKSNPKEIAYEKILNDKLFAREIDNYTFDKSFLKGDGTKIYVNIRKSLYWSEEGEILYSIVSFEDITERTKAYKEIEYMSYHDNLTGLFKRVYFENTVDELEQDQIIPTSILMGDVNGLKLTNDIFGHKEGDNLLVIMSDILKKYIGDKGTLCRWAGDEFAAVLPNTTQDVVEEICKNIKQECEQYIEDHPDLMTRPDISIGHATKLSTSDTLYDVFSRAETMMYRIKMADTKSQEFYTLHSLERTLIDKSRETEEHTSRLFFMARRFGTFLNLSEENIKKLELASKVHDIGKIAIKEEVLNKPSSLTPQEWIEIKRHPEIGYRIARTSPELIHVSEIILCHHERIDGAGYPRGLQNEDIPYLAKIVFIMDAFDAMYYDRVYRDAMELQDVLDELRRNAGTQFDAELVEQFIKFIRTDQIKSS